MKKKAICKITALLAAAAMCSGLCTDLIVNAREADAAASVSELRAPRTETDSIMPEKQTVLWDCVWFGSYPQSEVTDSDPIYRTLQDADGWDNKNDVTIDGNRYRRMKKEDATFTDSSKGFYPWSDDDTYHYFKYEPIKWRVLQTDGEQAFLLSDVALDAQQYNTEWVDVTWETSTIRSWLNGYGASNNQSGIDYSSRNFIGSAFTPDERAAIADTFVVNTDNISYGTKGGNDTTDKVFLLSELEVYGENAVPYGFVPEVNKWDEARRCKSSTYAKAMGTSYTSDPYEGECWWRMRSPGSSSNLAVGVDFYGRVVNGGYTVRSAYGMRPALNLNLSSGQWSYAGTVSANRTVAVEIESISLDKSELNLRAGETESLTATCVPLTSVKPKLNWKSGNNKVAIVDSNGLVRALSAGKTEIIVSLTDNDAVNASCILTVDEAMHITEQPQSVRGTIGEKAVIRIEAEGNELSYEWRRSTGEEINNSSYRVLSGDKNTLTVDITASGSKSVYWCRITDKNGIYMDSEPFHISYDIKEGCLANGICGESAEWTLYDNGILIVEGKGEISPDGRTAWGDFAKEIKKVIIRKGITRIGSRAFYDMSIQELFLPETVEEIGEEAFRRNDMDWPYLPGNLKKIEAGAFSSAFHSAISVFILPRSLETIEARAFEGCTIGTVSIPPSVTEIGTGNWGRTEQIECESDSYAMQYCQENDINYAVVDNAGHDARPCSGTCGEDTEWKFDEAKGVMTISGTGFMDDYRYSVYGWSNRAPWNHFMYGITDLIIEDGVRSVGDAAFCPMTSLCRVSLPRSIEKIGEGAFGECVCLEQLNANCHAPDLGYECFAIPDSIHLLYPQNAIGYDRSIWKEMLHEEQNTIISADEFSFYASEIIFDTGDKKEPRLRISPESFERAVQWESTDPSIIEVEKGVVKANAPGTADMLATLSVGGTDVTRRCKATVYGKPVFQYTKTCEKNLEEREFLLDACLTEGNGTLSYRSSDERVAKVDQNGKVTLNDAGSCFITVSVQEQEYYRAGEVQIQLYVKKKQDESNNNTTNNTVSNTMEDSKENKKTFPAEGAKLKDSKQKAVYVVTKAGKTVSYQGTGNKNMTVVSIPSKVKINNTTYTVTAIADNAFKDNKKIKKVTIPASVTKIGKKAFYNCRKLKTVTVKSKKLTAKNTGSKAFSKAGRDNYKKLVIKVPAGKYKAYKKLLKKKGLSAKAKVKKA